MALEQPLLGYGVRHHITEHRAYIRAVVGEGADKEDFTSFYKELQTLCTVRGF